MQSPLILVCAYLDNIFALFWAFKCVWNCTDLSVRVRKTCLRNVDGGKLNGRSAKSENHSKEEGSHQSVSGSVRAFLVNRCARRRSPVPGEKGQSGLCKFCLSLLLFDFSSDIENLRGISFRIELSVQVQSLAVSTLHRTVIVTCGFDKTCLS